MGAVCSQSCSFFASKTSAAFPASHSTIFSFLELAIHGLFRFAKYKSKTLLFTFTFFFFLKRDINKFHSLDQNKQRKIQIQGCPTLITVHQGSISCLYIELMRIHHPCQIHWTPNSNVKPNVRGHTFPLLTKSVIHKYYCYQTLHLQHLFRNMHM